MIYTPETNTEDRNSYKLFLAGSIENGKAEDWQDIICDQFKDCDDFDIYNPRRKNWNADATEEQVRQQIRWEQDALYKSDFVSFYFDPNTISPITLLELGLYIDKAFCIYCPPEYFRYTNVCETVKWYNTKKNRHITITDSIGILIEKIQILVNRCAILNKNKDLI